MLYLKITRRRFQALPMLLVALATPVASAANALQARDCDASGETLNCKLLDILHFLYGAAGILAILLILVVAVAIQFYRKNKQPPKDPQ